MVPKKIIKDIIISLTLPIKRKRCWNIIKKVAKEENWQSLPKLVLSDNKPNAGYCAGSKTIFIKKDYPRYISGTYHECRHHHQNLNGTYQQLTPEYERVVAALEKCRSKPIHEHNWDKLLCIFVSRFPNEMDACLYQIKKVPKCYASRRLAAAMKKLSPNPFSKITSQTNDDDNNNGT